MNEDLNAVMRSRKREKNVQPYLISMENAIENDRKFFVIVDQMAIPVGKNSVNALDILFKVHFCFDLKFAPDLTLFFNFLSGCIFGIEEVYPRTAELDNLLAQQDALLVPTGAQEINNI